MKVGIIRCLMTEDICPGKRAIPRAKMLVERGAEAIFFASCISRGNPIGYPCPHYANMRDAVEKAVGPDKSSSGHIKRGDKPFFRCIPLSLIR